MKICQFWGQKRTHSQETRIIPFVKFKSNLFTHVICWWHKNTSQINFETVLFKDIMYFYWNRKVLTHLGRVTHICISKITTIVSDNGLSPGRHQAIIWINAGILLIGPLGTKFSEIVNVIHTFSLKKMHLIISSGKWRSFCLGLNVLTLGR